MRLSERIWGYAITYKDFDCCKHYLVDASNGHYQFLGANQISHNTLSKLFKIIQKLFKMKNPIFIKIIYHCNFKIKMQVYIINI